MGRKAKVAVVALVVLAILLTAVLAVVQVVLTRYSIQTSRTEAASHVLFLGLDSRPGKTNGVPDSIVFVELATGQISQIPRNLESAIEGEPTFVEKYLGESNCEPFCSISGLYSLAQVQSSLVGEKAKEEAVDIVRTAIESEFQIESLAVVVYDLTWAYSFLTQISPIELDVMNPVPIGGFDAGTTYEGVERYISPGYQKLSGEELYWFARARFGSNNEDRMVRQSYLLTQILSQKNSVEIAEGVLGANGLLLTDLGLLDLPRLAGLSPAPSG